MQPESNKWKNISSYRIMKFLGFYLIEYFSQYNFTDTFVRYLCAFIWTTSILLIVTDCKKTCELLEKTSTHNIFIQPVKLWECYFWIQLKDVWHVYT